MLGISPTAWQTAQRTMGPVDAAVTVACILQQAQRIDRPGGYLRALTSRAAENRFNPRAMLLALSRPEAAS